MSRFAGAEDANGVVAAAAGAGGVAVAFAFFETAAVAGFCDAGFAHGFGGDGGGGGWGCGRNEGFHWVLRGGRFPVWVVLGGVWNDGCGFLERRLLTLSVLLQREL